MSGVLGIVLWFPSGQSWAQSVPNDAPSPGNSSLSLVPGSAFYVGAGGGYGRTNFSTQTVYGIGYSNLYTSNGTLTETGVASGDAYLSMPTRSTFVPSAQLGYFQHFDNSDWLWGGKIVYNYLGATSTVQNAILPQNGSSQFLGNPTPVPLTGYAVINSFQTTINHQVILAPMIGRSFEDGFVYGGAGPSLSNMQTRVDGVIGYAPVNGVQTDITGAPRNLFNSGWVFGGAIMVGGTYFFAPTWFLDLSYTFGLTTPQDATFSGPFIDNNLPGGAQTTGTAIVHPSGTVMTHAILLTINKAF